MDSIKKRDKLTFARYYVPSVSNFRKVLFNKIVINGQSLARNDLHGSFVSNELILLDH